MQYAFYALSLVVMTLIVLILGRMTQLIKRHADNMDLTEPGVIYDPEGNEKPPWVPIPVRSTRWYVGLYIVSGMQAVFAVYGLLVPRSPAWLFVVVMFAVCVLGFVVLYLNYRRSEDRRWKAMANNPAPTQLISSASR